jgi:gamma-glutamyltranspeptidase/glutathione hydrolase
VPVEVLLSEGYNAARRKLVGDKASLEQRPGHIEGFAGRVIVKGVGSARTAVSSAGAGEPTAGRMHSGHGADAGADDRDGSADGSVRGDTVHIDVIDRDGNMFTATPSGGWLQSSPVIPELGFCLGTRAQMFWLEEGHPAALAPGKRPRTTLSPTLALRDGESQTSSGRPAELDTLMT